MRKLMLGTAAVALAASLASSPANAQVKLDVSGYTKMYLSWLDQTERPDDPDTASPISTTQIDESLDVNDLDLMRDTEIHFTGETTLDNGLTVGFHTEAMADTMASGGGDSFGVQESYAYFSGAWGRVNLGVEDGATYLLQVAAPSADSNVDGIRQWINPIRYEALDIGGSVAGAFPGDGITFADIYGDGSVLTGAGASRIGVMALNTIVKDNGAAGTDAGDVRLGNNRDVLGALSNSLDYDHDVSGYENKITYMTPVFNGFQAGVSYTPELGHNGVTHNLDNTVNDFGDIWELAARYEGQWDQLGVTLGGGWSHSSLEADAAVSPPGVPTGCGQAIFYNDIDGSGACTDSTEVSATLSDREAWNVGIDLDWMAFGLGGGYMQDDNGVSGDELETQTWFVGLDYTTGPFKLGASYVDQNQAFGPADVDQDRWSAGVIYTYGPGMTFRGSISFYDFDENLGQRTANTSASENADATSFLLGTQIDF